MTKLEAVNLILRSNGMFNVGVLDPGGPSWQSVAEQFLDQASMEFQRRGFGFNLRRGIDLDRNGDNTVDVPTGCLEIYTTSSGVEGVQLGEVLYDRSVDGDTTTFDADPEATYVLLYEFSCVPPHIQPAIARRAAAEYCMAHGRPEKLRGLLAMAEREESISMNADSRIKRANVSSYNPFRGGRD